MLYSIKNYNVTDFLEWQEKGLLEISPKYQRGKVWNNYQQSYLIDTILNGLPIPPIFIREITDIKLKRTKREVIDGQQRLRAILNFIDNVYKISPSQTENTEYKNKYYENLEEENQRKILNFVLVVLIITNNDDSIIYDMFFRLNTNNVVLNKQEMRNAKYEGLFKSTVYSLAKIYRNDFLNLKTFNDKKISRMEDAKLISDLLILKIEGIQEGSERRIEFFYKKYNDEKSFNKENIEKKFKEIFNFMKKLLDNQSFQYFSNRNYLYTLFAYLDKQNNLSKINIKTFANMISNLEDKIEKLISKELLLDSQDNKEIDLLVKNHKQHTINIKEREERIEIFEKYIDKFIKK